MTRALALGAVRVGRVLLAHVPLGSVLVARIVNLLSRATWELTMKRAPRGTMFTCRLRSGARLELDLSERIQAQTALTGAYEPMLCDLIARELPPDGVFLDVGANVGLVTLEVASRARGKGVRVHAFEPHPDNLAALRRNLALNPGVDVEVVGAAAGAEPGTAQLLPSPSRNEAGAHRIVSGDGAAGTIEVPVMTIDEHLARNGIAHAHAMKVDAEGHEAAVIEGAGGLMSRRDVDLVLLEISIPLMESLGRDPEGMYEAMSEYGYAGTVIDSTSPTRLFPRMRRLAADDVAFRPSDRAPGAH